MGNKYTAQQLPALTPQWQGSNQDNMKLCWVDRLAVEMRRSRPFPGLVHYLLQSQVEKAVAGAEALRHCHRCLQPLRSALPGTGGQQLPAWERALGGKCRSGFSSLQPTEQALSSHPSCKSENPNRFLSVTRSLLYSLLLFSC